MRHLIAAVFLACLFGAIPLKGQDKDYSVREWRLGWGDMMFEQAAYRASRSRTDYHHIGHFYAGYRYSFNKWLSAGADIDFSTVNWKEQGAREHFVNLAILPSVRFTYFRGKRVTMYSGLGAGLLVNTGSETDYLGRRTVCAPAIDLTLYGISYNWDAHWCTSFELGGLNALNGKNEIFMLASRIFSISVGYRL